MSLKNCFPVFPQIVGANVNWRNVEADEKCALHETVIAVSNYFISSILYNGTLPFVLYCSYTFY